MLVAVQPVTGAQLPSSQPLGSDATAVSLWGGTEPP